MRILYVFPHPDDESFGVAHAMHKQRRDGHEVYLLTLTRGGATRQRHRYGYSVEEMGAVRLAEMQQVARVLDLSGMTVLDLVDSGLKEMDPRQVERVIAEEIDRRRPQVVVTYAVHGISGFHDHLVSHAVVKRVFVGLAERAEWLQRLAFFTLPEADAHSEVFPLSGSTEEEIDCVVRVQPEDLAAAHRALDCYVTFQETIARTGIKDALRAEVCFEIFGERHDPPLDDLFAGLRD